MGTPRLTPGLEQEFGLAGALPGYELGVRRVKQRHVMVVDDGIGSEGAGSGLQGLHDSVDAVGGQLTVTSPASVGTTLVASFPVAESTP